MSGSFGSSKQSSNSQASIDPDQKQFLMNLWGQGQNLTGVQTPGSQQEVSQGLVDQVTPGAQQGYNQALNAGQGLNNFTDPNNALATEQINQLGGDISRNLNENVLPGLTNSAIMGGNLGGSRGQIGAGLAAQGAQDAFSRGATGLRGNAYNQAQNASVAQSELNLAGGQAGLEGASNLYNLGMTPYQAAWGPLQQFSSLLGNPTVLNSGSSKGSSLSFGFGG